MTENGLLTSLGRFTSDYGMIFVLILLGGFFSFVTYKEQNPTGATAGAMLARDLLDNHPRARVVILADPSAAGRAFAETLQADLEAGGVTIVQNVQGDMVDVRKAFQQIEENGTDVDVLACTGKTARYPLIRNRAKIFSSLSSAAVAIPKSYGWPVFLKASNLRNVASRIAIIAIIAIGMTLVIITAGIDLSVGSLIAFSAVLTTYLIREYGGAREASAIAMVLCAIVGAGTCALLGAFTGSMVTLFGIPAFIASLSMMLAASGLAYILSNSESIYQLPESFTTLGRGTILGIPNPVALTLFLYAIAHIIMTRTVFGRYVYAVGGNPDAARLSGVPVRRILLLCYTICGALAGLGGVIQASELKSGAPNFGFMTELDVIAAVVVGGTSLLGGEGKILGTLIGALIIAVILNGMNLLDVGSNLQKVVLGLVILGAVVLDRIKKRS